MGESLNMKENEGVMTIEKLIQYGLKHDMLDQLDIPQIRNQLMDILGETEPYEGDVCLTEKDSLTGMLEVLVSGAVQKGIIEEGLTNQEILDSKLMAQLLPRQSELYRKFYKISCEKGIEAATDYFYKLSKDSNYIRMDRIEKNIVWKSVTEYGKLEITINLSKPEKDPKDIAKAKNAPSLHYPKCQLCLENVGFPGNINHPARSNHRVIPMKLHGEQWYFQYSPYVYYNEHAIVFKRDHEPMKICRETFVRLLDFVEQFPHYFLGSNADLPIVGGSILSHDHFQGGHHVFPMAVAPALKQFGHPDYTNIRIKRMKWPLSVIRIEGNDRSKLVELSVAILESWRAYSDESVGVHAFTDRTPHNTITPIARMNKQGLFELDLVLRNNRQSVEHPDGIFHPHQHLHHIKKENIGLIEVMGLAVLPPRLKEELAFVTSVLTGEVKAEELPEFMEQHKEWIQALLQKYGCEMQPAEAEAMIRQEVSNKFSQVLECAGVYKMTEEGQKAFDLFLTHFGCIEMK